MDSKIENGNDNVVLDTVSYADSNFDYTPPEDTSYQAPVEPAYQAQASIESTYQVPNNNINYQTSQPVTFSNEAAYPQGNYQYGSGYDQPVNYQGEVGYQQDNSYQVEVNKDVSMMSFSQWLVTVLAIFIPIGGIILYLIWAFDKSGDKSRKDYCKAMLIVLPIFIIILIAIVIFIFNNYLHWPDFVY